MIGQAFDRFKPYFGQFVLIGLVAALLGFFVPALVFVIFGGFSLMVAGAGGLFRGDPTAVFGAALGALSGLGLAVVAAVLVAPFSYGIQMVAARDALYGQEVSLGRAFDQAKAIWGRILGYGVLVVLTGTGAGLIGMIPLLGWLFLLAFIILAGPAFIYGLYALVNENLGAGAAYSRVWQGLSKRLGEHFLAGLVLLGLAIVLNLVFVILGFIPILGWLAAILLSFVATSFFMLYLGLRYETNVRPYLVEQQAAPSEYPQGPTS